MTRVFDLRRAVKHNAKRPWLLPAFGLLLLVACRQGEPAGQVLASVNGEEITIPELNAEARARGLSIGDNRELEKSLLGELVDRKLLAQEALKQKLDRTPDYLLAQRRANEILLTQELLSTATAAAPEPTSQELAQVVKSNPRTFDQRALIQVDQITIPTGIAAPLSKALQSAKSLDDIASSLTARRVRFSRRVEVWDSAELSPAATEKLLAAKAGGLALLGDSQNTIVAKVGLVTPDPVPPAEQNQVAGDLLRSQRQQQLLQSLLRDAKASAKIRYQPGFVARK